MQKAALITAITGVCAFFTLGAFAVFSDVNVFVIFGVILASAVGGGLSTTRPKRRARVR